MPTGSSKLSSALLLLLLFYCCCYCCCCCCCFCCYYSVSNAMLAQARLLFRALFVCLCFFELSLLCALGGGDDGVGSVGPLVDDYLIYCNITHTRIAINDSGGQTLTGELKAEIKVLSAAIRELLCGFYLRHHPLLDSGRSETIGSWINRG